MIIYKEIASFHPPNADDLHSKVNLCDVIVVCCMENNSTQAKDWIRNFLSLGQHCQGFQKKNVTPYMHALVYHVPDMLKSMAT